MELPVSPLVLTKLRVPSARPRLISRERLLEPLTPAVGASCILVCAPAGYGKTTLLVDWAHALQKRGAAVAWYALDPGDNDIIPFRSYLIASLVQAFGPNPELTQIAQLLRASPERDLQRFLPVIINAILSVERECVLILDDYHLIGDPAVHSMVVYLLEHLPENLRVAIGTRSDPPLPLARLRALGQLLEIRTSSLRFTPGETARFLNGVMQLDLSTQSIAALEERTEGWIAGLQLAALSLAGRTDQERLIASFSGSHRHLIEYLMDEVVNRQPEEVQTFLLSTSILERMCGDLCEAILGDRGKGIRDSAAPAPLSLALFDSQAVLEYLEKSNLFLVPLDDERTWYRYHHLFRDFLQARLNKTHPERTNLLHRAACEWLAEHGFLREAAGHAFQSHDWEYAANFIERHNFTLIVHSDISSLYEWCSAIPEEVMQRRPMLCILQALALAYSFRRQNRARVEARLQQADLLIGGMEDRQAARGLIDLAAVVRTFLAMAPDPSANPREILALAKGMLDAYPEGDGGQFSGLLLTGYAYLALQEAGLALKAFETARQIALREGLYFGIVELTFHLARLAHSQGQLRRAAEICQQGRAEIESMLAHPEEELPALGCLDVALGCVFLEQDRLSEAEEHLRRGLGLMGGGMNPYYLMTAYIALFRLYVIQNQPLEAMKFLDRLEATWPDFVFCTDGLRFTHRLRSGGNDLAKFSGDENWLQWFSSLIAGEAFSPGMGTVGAAEGYYLASLEWVRAQIATGQASSTWNYLERQLDLARTHDLRHRVIELSLLESLANQSEGDSERAFAALKQALSLAQPENYIRIFDQGPAMSRLLCEAHLRAGEAQLSAFTGYIEQILDSFGVLDSDYLGQEGSATSSALTPFGESLSERELEVLRLIAQGATNQEIANRLFITVGTVKSHINHILGKLDSHNRTEAVARARRLGLLEI